MARANKRLPKKVRRSNPNFGYVPEPEPTTQAGTMPLSADYDDDDDGEQGSYVSYTSEGDSPLIDFPQAENPDSSDKLLPEIMEEEEPSPNNGNIHEDSPIYDFLDDRQRNYADEGSVGEAEEENNSSRRFNDNSDLYNSRDKRNISEEEGNMGSRMERRMSDGSETYNSSRKLEVFTNEMEAKDDISDGKFLLAMAAIAAFIIGGISLGVHKQIISSVQNVNSDNNDQNVIPIPTGINWMCSSGRIASGDREECENVCKPAKCCWAQFTESCYQENKVICEDYRLCQNLILGEEDEQAIKAEVAQACNDDVLVSPTKREICHNLCDYRMCCFETNEKKKFGCNESMPEVCEVFDACKIMVSPTPHPAPTNHSSVRYKIEEDIIVDMVANVCDEGIFDSEDKMDVCQTLCYSRLCCFAEKEKSCKDTHKKECKAFDACKILIG